MLTAIKNTKDVAAFAVQLIKEGVNFHPDDDFKDYVNLKTKKPCYTRHEAELRNNLMNQCFEVCKNTNADIYSIMFGVTLKETGMNKYIPLPSVN